MKNTRRGLGKGLGTGYKNLAPKDSMIHGLSAKGVKTQKPYFIKEPFGLPYELTRKGEYREPKHYPKPEYCKCNKGHTLVEVYDDRLNAYVWDCPLCKTRMKSARNLNAKHTNACFNSNPTFKTVKYNETEPIDDGTLVYQGKMYGSKDDLKYMPNKVRLVKLSAKARMDWVDRVFGKTSKKKKRIIKGVVYTAGALALIGASAQVAKNIK